MRLSKKSLFSGVLFLVIILLLFLGSCKKDKEETLNEGPTGTGSVFYNESTYSLNRAAYELYGQFGGVYNYELYLFSEGIDVDTETGTGNIVSMYFSTYVAPLPAGTIPYYTFNVPEVPTFSASLYLEYDLVNETGIRFDGFEDGEVTISRSGDTYTVEFTCYSMGQDTITGQYTGKILEI
jgi:hypothetical protein